MYRITQATVKLLGQQPIFLTDDVADNGYPGQDILLLVLVIVYNLTDNLEGEN